MIEARTTLGDPRRATPWIGRDSYHLDGDKESAEGQSRRFRDVRVMSGSPPTPDIRLIARHGRKGPGGRHDAKVSNSGFATAEFEFSAHTLLPMQSTTPLDCPTNWMLPISDERDARGVEERCDA
jgi:hypothetical protein